MAPKNKSVLDSVPVVDKAFPITATVQTSGQKPSIVGIVGHCPKCGAPIYGHSVLPENQIMESVRYSCKCSCLLYSS